MRDYIKTNAKMHCEYESRENKNQNGRQNERKNYNMIRDAKKKQMLIAKERENRTKNRLSDESESTDESKGKKKNLNKMNWNSACCRTAAAATSTDSPPLD